MENLELLDVVVLNKAIPTSKLRKGEIGTIVEELDSSVFLVEFADTKGVTYAMTAINASDLIKVYYAPALA